MNRNSLVIIGMAAIIGLMNAQQIIDSFKIRMLQMRVNQQSEALEKMAESNSKAWEETCQRIAKLECK